MDKSWKEKVEEVAKKWIYNDDDRPKFVAFMMERFPDVNDEFYAQNWANRFNSSDEILCKTSDLESTFFSIYNPIGLYRFPEGFQ
jgi:hypothetical protein